jgi:hypothetical protein
VFEDNGNATVDKLIAEFEHRLPADMEHPAMPLVLQEINAWQERLGLLKQSIGQG